MADQAPHHAALPEFAPLADTDRLDQHFLDTETAHTLVAAGQVTNSDVVLEIGAGTGILTAAILSASPAAVIAVETDDRCRPYLSPLQRSRPTLNLIMSKVQDVNVDRLARTSMIIANPPFSVLEHLTRLVRQLPRQERATLCVSSRWARSVVEPLDGPAYSIVSMALQSRFRAEIIGRVPRHRFTPPARKPAALLRLTRLALPDAGLDVLADALLWHGGLRVKSFLRSNRFRRAFGDHGTVLHDPGIRGWQQRRLTELSGAQIATLVSLLKRAK